MKTVFKVTILLNYHPCSFRARPSTLLFSHGAVFGHRRQLFYVKKNVAPSLLDV